MQIAIAMVMLTVGGMIAVTGLAILHTMAEGNVQTVSTYLLLKVWGLCFAFGIPIGLAGYFLAQ